MAVQQRVKSLQANSLEIPLYWTLRCFQETLANKDLLGDHRKKCKIAITEKCARIKKRTDAVPEHNELFAIPVYRVKEFSKECREKR